MGFNDIRTKITSNYLKKLIFVDVEKSLFDCLKGNKGDIIPIPLLYSNLVDKVKEGSAYEAIPTNDILEGIAVLLGCDSKFKFKNEYINILNMLSSSAERMLWHSGLDYMNKGFFEVAYIIFCFLIETYENNNVNSFKYNQALCIYNLAVGCKDLTEQQKLLSFGIELFEDVNNDKDIIKNDYLGILYKLNKDYQKAFENFGVFIEEFDSKKDNEWFNYIKNEYMTLKQVVQFENGVFNFENYKHEKALAYFLPLEQKNPEWFALIFLIGKCYRALEDSEMALEYYSRALELDDSSADLYNEIGLCYYMLRDIENAKINILRANKLEAENIVFMTNLCSIYLEMDDINAAENLINHALKISPEDEVTIKCKEILDKRKKEKKDGRQ